MPWKSTSRRLRSRRRLSATRYAAEGLSHFPEGRGPNLAIRSYSLEDGNSGAESQPLFGHLRSPFPSLPFDLRMPRRRFRSGILGLGDGRASCAGEERDRDRKAEARRPVDTFRNRRQSSGDRTWPPPPNCKAPNEPRICRSSVTACPRLRLQPGWTTRMPTTRHIRVPTNVRALDFDRQVETKYSDDFSVYESCIISQLFHIFSTHLST